MVSNSMTGSRRQETRVWFKVHGNSASDLWIVDVNKTDMGPPIALPMADKLKATRTLAHALRAHVDARLTSVET